MKPRIRSARWYRCAAFCLLAALPMGTAAADEPGGAREEIEVYGGRSMAPSPAQPVEPRIGAEDTERTTRDGGEHLDDAEELQVGGVRCVAAEKTPDESVDGVAKSHHTVVVEIGAIETFDLDGAEKEPFEHVDGVGKVHVFATLAVGSEPFEPLVGS